MDLSTSKDEQFNPKTIEEAKSLLLSPFLNLSTNLCALSSTPENIIHPQMQTQIPQSKFPQSPKSSQANRPNTLLLFFFLLFRKKKRGTSWGPQASAPLLSPRARCRACDQTLFQRANENIDIAVHICHNGPAIHRKTGAKQ